MRISKGIALTIIIQTIVIACLFMDMREADARNERKDKMLREYENQIYDFKYKNNLNLN